MADISVSGPRNIWLNSLTAADCAVLVPQLVRVPLERDAVLAHANKPQTQIYFPEGGVVSVVADTPDVGMTEVGLFGREGMSGLSALLGVDTTPQRTFVQIDGTTALRIPTEAMRAALADSVTLRTSFALYVHTVMSQLYHSIVSNARHALEARLARWLLMCHDRIDGDEIALTHEFMAVMIGAQRTGVTVTLHVLEGGGMIRSKRGRVIMIDRAMLQQLAGSAYGPPEAEYRRLIGDFGRPVEGSKRADQPTGRVASHSR